MKSAALVLMIILIATAGIETAMAGVTTHAIRETAEFVLKKFGVEAAEQGTELLSRRIGTLATRFGDDALTAFTKVGPKVSRLADDAADHAGVAVRLLARHGDDAVRLVVRPQQLSLVARLGDDAADVVLRHGDAVEPLLSSCGTAAANALSKVSTQNGRRLSMLFADGHLTKLGRTEELLAVISRFGDTGAEFLWRNKAGLTVGATLTAFLASPEAFIKGGADLAAIAADSVVKPVVTTAAEVFPWFTFLGLSGVCCGFVFWIRRVPASLNRVLLRVFARVVKRRLFSHRKD